jgi:hypothetical protein
MRTLTSRWLIVLGVLVGVILTLVAVNRGSRPLSSRTGAPHNSAPSRGPPDRDARKSNGSSEWEHPAESTSPGGNAANRVARNDSTYSRMLALVVSRSDAADVTRKITEMHERFVLAPDDPDWGSQTEQALRDFFDSRSANKSGGIEVTSVSCRSDGCEVQAEVQMKAAGDQASAGPEGASAVGHEGRPADPREVLYATWPLGPSLRLEECIGSDLQDRVGNAEVVGFIVWYTRVRPNSEAASTEPQLPP